MTLLNFLNHSKLIVTECDGKKERFPVAERTQCSALSASVVFLWRSGPSAVL